MVFFGTHFGHFWGRRRPDQAREDRAREDSRAQEDGSQADAAGPAGPELWGAVMREGPSPAEDTRAALDAIRASLDAARRLRFAGEATEDERRRLAALAAEAAGQQERALRLWAAGRGLDTPAEEATP